MDDAMNNVGSTAGLPLLRRVRYSPLRDLLRLRATGRWDVRRLVVSSDLPMAVGELVLEVVRRTRLWRSEKADVARELVAHFQDGLAGGASRDSLIRSFGDPRTAAKLIRKAKKRRRPLIWRMMRRTAQAFGLLLALLIVLYAVIAVRFFMGTPTPTRDYLAEMNRTALATPTADRAWPVYRQGLLSMPGLRALLVDHRDAMPGQPDWEPVAGTLRQERQGLALLRQAAGKPALGFMAGYAIAEEDRPLLGESESARSSLGSDAGVIAVMLPYLTQLRQGARLLSWEAQQAAVEGDGELFAADVAAMLGMAEHVAEQPILISDLVSFSIGALAFQTLGDGIEEHPEMLSDAQLQALAHRITAFRGGGALNVHLEGERMGFDDLVQRIYTDDGAGDGTLTAEGMRLLLGVTSLTGSDRWVEAAMPVASVVTAGRRDLLAEYDRISKLAQGDFQKPLWSLEQFAGEQELERRRAGSMLWQARYMTIDLLMPALSHSHVVAEQATQRRDAILTAIALELYRRHEGGWPDSLSLLVPRYMPSVPPDRFDGKPLKYRLIDGRPVVYSIGTDRDDDGGTPPQPDALGRVADASRWISANAVEQYKLAPDREARLADGDWLLWPRVREPVRPRAEGAPPQVIHFAAPTPR